MTGLLYVAQIQLEGEALELVGACRSAPGVGQLLDQHLAGIDAHGTGFAGPTVPGAMTGEVADDASRGILGYSLVWAVPAEKLTRGLREVLEADRPMLPRPDLVRNVERALDLLRRVPLHENDRIGAINLLTRGLQRADDAARREALRREDSRRRAAHLEVVK
jgi:hypothetical protein